MISKLAMEPERAEVQDERDRCFVDDLGREVLCGDTGIMAWVWAWVWDAK
jgi:hypothetical protein